MSLSRKVNILTFLLVGFIAYSVISFDYSNIAVEEEKYTVSTKPVKTESKNIEFEIVKSNNIVVISGLFKNEAQVEFLANYLNINKTDHKTYDKAVAYSQENIDEIKKLISPLKDYFEEDSKIILKDKMVSIDGTLKDKKLKPLLEAILNRSSISISTNFIEKKEIEVVEQEEPEIEYISLQEEINNLLKEEKINFKTNSTILDSQSEIVVKKIAELINNTQKEVSIEVAGHTDAKGKKSTNKWISAQRAKSVMKKLIEYEVNEETIVAKGYGESRPIVLNNPEGYSKINRRVEIIVLDLEKIEEDRVLLQEEIDQITKEQKINFERRSTNVTKDSLLAIGKIAQFINKSENLSIEIGGHTDAKGKKSLNKWISEKRAKSVMTELINFEVDKSKLTAVGYGEEQPIAQNDENGLSEINRRVEFIVKGVR